VGGTGGVNKEKKGTENRRTGKKKKYVAWQRLPGGGKEGPVKAHPGEMWLWEEGNDETGERERKSLPGTDLEKKKESGVWRKKKSLVGTTSNWKAGTQKKTRQPEKKEKFSPKRGGDKATGWGGANG